MLRLLPALGEFVPAGTPLFEVSGELKRVDASAALRSINIGLERTLDQDMAYGVRMLVDIAERSLSDGPFLDPTTRCKRSTGCTIACASWPRVLFLTARTAMKAVPCGW
jgi:uncharacterized membrane protein